MSIRTVGLYFYRLGSSAGGAERMICDLANALLGRGFIVHLVSWDDESAVTFYPLNEGVIWHRLGFTRGYADKLRRSRLLAKLLRNNDVRTLVGFVMSNDKTVYAAVKLAGVKLVVAERNAPTMYYLRYSAIQRWLTFILLRLADRITLQFTDFTAGYPASLAGRMETIPNPVPLASDKAQPNIPDMDGRFTLLAVSRLDGVQKRLGCLLRAFALVVQNQPGWILKIIGDGPEEGGLRELALALGITEQVRFVSPTPNIFTAYTKAHLFVIPSLWEGFPNALAEALAHGLPAVGFHGAAGVENLISAGNNGWLAEILDSEISLANSLRLAMADGSERVRRGKLAVKSMADYVPEIQFDRWEALLETLASGGTP